MKKSYIALLLAATLGLGSCNDIQELSVDFGERTYINDYQNLVDAVNNLSLSLKERFDALSELLKKGMEDIRISIDANTGAIKVISQDINNLDDDMKDGLSAINTSIFNGFNAVCTQIDDTGKTIVAAIDSNGNLLRLQIDATGKLLSAQLVTSTADLIKAMKENNVTLAEKLGLVDASIQAGFAKTSEGQKDIKEAIKEAIAALTEQVKAGNATTQEALKDIKGAITSQTTSLEVKLAAIEEANKQGLASIAAANDLIKQSVNALTEEVKAGNKSTKEALEAIKVVIESQTLTLATKLEAIESATFIGFLHLSEKTQFVANAIASLEAEMKSDMFTLAQKLGDIEAVNKNGFADIKTVNGLIKEAIASLETEVKAGNISNETALKNLKDAVTAQTSSLETKLAAIQQANATGLATLAEKNELIKSAVASLEAEVKAGNTSNATALNNLKEAVTSQTTDLSSKISLLQTAMTTGFGNDKSAIDAMTTAVTTAINNLKTEVQNGNTNNATYLAQMVSGLTTLNTTMGTTNTQLGNIKDVLTKELADNGVTIDPDGDGKSVLVTPDIWNDIEKAGATSQLYNTFMDAIKDVTVPKVIDPIQVTPASAGRWHTCASFINDGYDENTVALRAGTLQPMTAANGKTVIKVIKTPSEVKFHIEGLWRNGYLYCTYSYIYNIRVFDARGDYQVYGGASGNETGSRATIGEATSRAVPTTKVYTANIILKAYYNGRICDEVKAYVFTYDFDWASDLPNLFWPSTPDPKP